MFLELSFERYGRTHDFFGSRLQSQAEATADTKIAN